MNQDVSSLKANWNYPTTIRFGCGRVDELADACQELGIFKPLLVTDKGLAEHEMVKHAMEMLLSTGLGAAVFSEVKPNPDGDSVSAGLECFRQGKHDGIIGFGGGSALDAAKAIALMAGQSKSLWDFEDVGDNWTRVNPKGIANSIAIPTTAGTGSEVGRASVIVDGAEHKKKIIFHPQMLPKLVIADPELTVGLPANITAATGMDALSHNLEAYCAPGYHPMADGIALEAMRLIKENLLRAYREPADLSARGHMLIASSMGATAFQKGLGAIHALAHPLGARYDAHHGLLNAVLMPYVLVQNKTAIGDKMQRLARYLELPDESFKGILDFVLELRRSLAIPHNLLAIGIDAQHKNEIGRLATQDPSAGGNPIELTEQQYTDLFARAVAGQLEM